MAKGKMKKRKMTVTLEDGLVITFIKENKTVKFIMLNGGCIHENEVDEDSIQAKVGKPLSFTYYYGYGSRDELNSEDNLIKEIIYSS